MYCIEFFSKVLANKLKKVLPHLVSEQQSAFVKGRLISDNIMVAFKTLHYMTNHSSGETRYMALKLDMSKACDRVEWLYMEKLTKNIGFGDTWINLMMQCISKATYSVLINREPHGHITPTRGLLQGDSVSILILIMHERLPWIIEKSRGEWRHKGCFYLSKCIKTNTPSFCRR